MYGNNRAVSVASLVHAVHILFVRANNRAVHLISGITFSVNVGQVGVTYDDLQIFPYVTVLLCLDE